MCVCIYQHFITYSGSTTSYIGKLYGLTYIFCASCISAGTCSCSMDASWNRRRSCIYRRCHRNRIPYRTMGRIYIIIYRSCDTCSYCKRQKYNRIKFTILSVVAALLIDFLGMLWLTFIGGHSIKYSFTYGFVPFLPLDLIKAVVVAQIVPLFRRVIAEQSE